MQLGLTNDRLNLTYINVELPSSLPVICVLSIGDVVGWPLYAAHWNLSESSSGKSVQQSWWVWCSGRIFNASFGWISVVVRLPVSFRSFHSRFAVIHRKNAFDVFDAAGIRDFDELQIRLVVEIVFHEVLEIQVVVEVVHVVDSDRGVCQVVVHLGLVCGVRARMLNVI